MHAKEVVTPEGEIISRLWNVVAAIASTLRPVAMVAAPIMIATLLKTGMRLPGAIPGPSALLLPIGGLLPGALRLLLLPCLLNRLGGALLRLPGLLSWLGGALLLRFRLCLGTLLLLRFGLSLGTLLLLRFRLCLGTLLLRLSLNTLLLLRFRLGLGTLLLRLGLGMLLLLCGSRRGLPGLWFGLRFLLLFVLGVGRDNCPEKHNNGSGTNNSRDLHSHYLR